LLFFSKNGDTLDHYLALDDAVILGALRQLQYANDEKIRSLAKRILNRDLYKTFDLESASESDGRRKRMWDRIEKLRKSGAFSGVVWHDFAATVNIYSTISDYEERAHKKLRIAYQNGKSKEITSVSKLIETVERDKKPLIRYYFENESDRQLALKGR